ncbi:WecB/TagA/CpsF family glycosyltransferase [Pseudomonas sp. OIL-1]|nr:WecB/TagA/CpsF family glycosyltransferase [Pseudomonas sp. OIL-1]
MRICRLFSDAREVALKAFDIEFYEGSEEQLVDEIRTTSQEDFSYIVTPNVNHVVQLKDDRQLRAAYDQASHRICDSRVLLPFLKICNLDLQEAIPGSTLTARLIHLADQLNWKVCVVGCEANNMMLLREKFPGITFYHHYPPMGFIKDEQATAACLDFIVDHPAQLVVFALGCPTQEILAQKVFQTGRAKGVGLCVGGSLNFLSGAVPRAPEWVQKLYLEWLHRICSEPRRLTGRYARDGVRFIPILVKQLRTKQPLSYKGA